MLHTILVVSMPQYKRIDTNKEERRKGLYVFLLMGDVVIFDQPPVSEVRVPASPGAQPRTLEVPTRPAPRPARPARTAAAAARTAFLFSDTFLGTGFTFSLLTTPCGSAGDLLVPETVRCVHLTQNINSEFRDLSPFILTRPAHGVREEAFSDVDIWWWKK